MGKKKKGERKEERKRKKLTRLKKIGA